MEAAGAGCPGVPVADGQAADRAEEAVALLQVVAPAAGGEVAVGYLGKDVGGVGATEVEKI